MVNFGPFWALYLRFMRIILIALIFTRSPAIVSIHQLCCWSCSLQFNYHYSRRATVRRWWLPVH